MDKYDRQRRINTLRKFIIDAEIDIREKKRQIKGFMKELKALEGKE